MWTNSNACYKLAMWLVCCAIVMENIKYDENIQIKKENIFCAEYEALIKNNEIEFSNNKIAVIYGPNGAGKTS